MAVCGPSRHIHQTVPRQNQGAHHGGVSDPATSSFTWDTLLPWLRPLRFCVGCHVMSNNSNIVA